MNAEKRRTECFLNSIFWSAFFCVHLRLILLEHNSAGALPFRVSRRRVLLQSHLPRTSRRAHTAFVPALAIPTLRDDCATVAKTTAHQTPLPSALRCRAVAHCRAPLGSLVAAARSAIPNRACGRCPPVP